MKNLNPTTTLEAMPTCEAVKTTMPVASCEKNHETLRATASSQKNCRGHVSSQTYSGAIYGVDGTEYVLTREGDIISYRGDELTEDAMALIRPVVIEMVKEDQEIENAQCALARLEAGGDRIKNEILLMHLWFTGGSMVEDNQKDGIQFYQVGRNVSHEFYCGVKDGQRYIASWCPEWDEESAEQEAPTFEKQAEIYPVETFNGHYLGHG